MTESDGEAVRLSRTLQDLCRFWRMCILDSIARFALYRMQDMMPGCQANIDICDAMMAWHREFKRRFVR